MEESNRRLRYLRERHQVYFGYAGNLNYEILYPFDVNESANKYFVESTIIANYDKMILDKYFEKIRSGVLRASTYSARSIFIENCYYELNNFNKEELRLHLFKNYITYAWWDILTLEELAKVLYRFCFSKSTELMLGLNDIIDHLKLVYKDKDNLLQQIYQNFDFPDSCIYIPENPSNINYNCSIESEYNQLDYRWRINQYIVKSIRSIENEVRSTFNLDNVGTLFNESVLYREIVKNFGKRFKVLSQGSPDWLGNQRFDIYLPELNIAIEYQGEQHFYPVDFGGKGVKLAKKQFEENKKRDIIKIQKATQNNCIIIFAMPKYELETVLQDIENAINERCSSI
jgi:hypothetical protein